MDFAIRFKSRIGELLKALSDFLGNDFVKRGEIDRLDQVLSETGLSGPRLMLGAAITGQRDERQAGEFQLPLDLLGHVVARYSGHRQIQKNDVWAKCHKTLQ